MADAMLATARAHRQQVETFSGAQRRTLQINGRVTMLAADAYYAEQHLMGVEPIEPWSALGADQQRVYVKRVQAMLASGIGHVDAKAKRRAVTRISVTHRLHDKFGDYAREIEQAIGEAFNQHETELIALFKEQAR